VAMALMKEIIHRAGLPQILHSVMASIYLTGHPGRGPGLRR
jgi:hypothetical protein